MEWVLPLLPQIAIAFVILIAGALIQRFIGGKAETSVYQSRQFLLSKAERSFYGVLLQAVRDRAVVMAKVRVADVLEPEHGVGGSRWQKAFNRISSKHFDFVLCKPDDLSIVAAIELDDKSHNKRQRGQRDEFLNKACGSAQLPLHRIKARKNYSVEELRNLLFPADQAATFPVTNISNSPEEADKSKQPSDTPSCPKCGAALVKRKAAKGKHKGEIFWGCSAYPKCRYIKKLTPKHAAA